MHEHRNHKINVSYSKYLRNNFIKNRQYVFFLQDELCKVYETMIQNVLTIKIKWKRSEAREQQNGGGNARRHTAISQILYVLLRECSKFIQNYRLE